MVGENHLYVWDDRFLYLTGAIVAGITRRYTVTLLVSLGDEGFTLGDAQGKQRSYQAALVGHDVPRSLDARRAPLLSLNFDPQSYEYHSLAAMLGRHAVRPVILRQGALSRHEFFEIFLGDWMQYSC